MMELKQILAKHRSILSALFVIFAVLLIFCWVASRGLNPLKKLATIAGTSMFIMSILYIIMMFGARAINPGADYVSLDFSLKNLIPQFNVKYFTSLSILVFAVGGCEKISPYVNKVKDPSKGFPRAMISLAIMVVVCAILGTVAIRCPEETLRWNPDALAFDGNPAATALLRRTYRTGW